MPREGPVRGGGAMKTHDPVLHATLINDLDVELPAGPLSSLDNPRRSSAHAGPTAQRKKGAGKGGETGPSAGVSTSDSPRSSTNYVDKGKGKDKPRLSPEERKRMEIFSKWEKTEALRERDHKEIVEHVDKQHDMRDARFKRLLEAVTGRDNLAYKTAIALREREQHAEQRRRDLYSAWDETVYQPIATQAYLHLNPPNRAMEQKLAGSKSVNFRLPQQVFTLVANVHQDPARKPVVDVARENSFHQAASSVLRTSQSAPNIHAQGGQRRPAQGTVVPRAMSRPVLEPMNWGQVNIQGSMYGHFAQVAEHGEGFKRGRKGGTDAFVPDDADGVIPSGTRHSRIMGYHDVGVLRGETAVQGESSNFKAHHGMSHGAPMQDHFLYEVGKNVTNLEFPLGKRIFPERISVDFGSNGRT